MKNYYKNRQNSGITLIALIVTIIVLLILAGISIAMLTEDNSILKRSTDAKETSGIAQKQEELQLAISELRVDYHTKNNETGTFRDYIFSEEERKGQETLKAELGASNLSFDSTKYQIYYKEIVFDILEDGTIRKTNETANSGVTEELVNPTSVGLTIPDTLEVGDTVTWTPSGHYEWNKEYYSDDENNVTRMLYSGTEVPEDSVTSWSAAGTNMNLTISSWKVLNIDSTNNKVTLVPAVPSSVKVLLKGVQGYNNGVKLLHEACSALYGNGNGISARSISMVDLEGTARDGSNGLMSADTSIISTAKGAGFPVRASSPYTASHSIYPKIYEEEALRKINGVESTTGIGQNDLANIVADDNGFISKSIGKVTTATSIQPAYTAYFLNLDDFKAAIGTTNANILVPYGSWTSIYWVASRCIDEFYMNGDTDVETKCCFRD